MTNATCSTAHVLYRFYSATGQLLYVGITMSPPDRFKSHRKTKEWWESVSGITVESYDSRDDLVRAERRAIQVERPLHNVVHNGSRRTSSPTNPRPPATGCTTKNPLGMVDHDSSKLAQLPGWRALAQAVNRVALEANSAGVAISPDYYAEALGLLARSVGYMDCCQDCERMPDRQGQWLDTSVAPHKVRVHDGSMCGHYQCPEGHTWFCWHTLRQVEFA